MNSNIKITNNHIILALLIFIIILLVINMTECFTSSQHAHRVRHHTTLSSQLTNVDNKPSQSQRTNVDNNVLNKNLLNNIVLNKNLLNANLVNKPSQSQLANALSYFDMAINKIHIV